MKITQRPLETAGDVCNELLPYRWPSVDVESCLVLGMETAEDFGVLATDMVVVLSQVGQTPVSKLIGIMHLERKSCDLQESLPNARVVIKALPDRAAVFLVPPQ